MRARLFAACALSVLAAGCSGSNSIEVTAPTAVKCEVTAANAMSGAVPASGATSAVTVTTTRDCTWTAASNASWVTLGDTSGQGGGSIEYRVAANGDPAQRRAAINVNNTQVAVVQDAAPCRFSVSPTSTAVSAVGGPFSVALDTLTGCAWTAASDSSWVAINANSSGNRSATIAIGVAPNTGPLRRGTITIGDAKVAVEQAAFSPSEPVPCSYSITPTMQNVSANAGNGTINVTAGTGCAWTATTTAPWITVTSGASGSGNGAIAFVVSANTGAARMATMMVAGQTATITQAAAPCAYAIGSSSQTVPPEGGTGSVGVTAGGACAWTSTSNASWITITNGASGTGNGSVALAIAANTGPARSGTVTIGGQTLTINQAAAAPPPCSITIAPPNQGFPATGGSGSVTVTASAATCTWTATSNAPWLTISGGASGTGNGSVGFSVAANSGAARTGTLTISGQTFTVNQAGPPPPPPPP